MEYNKPTAGAFFTSLPFHSIFTREHCEQTSPSAGAEAGVTLFGQSLPVGS